jgi:hypothetical protein
VWFLPSLLPGKKTQLLLAGAAMPWEGEERRGSGWWIRSDARALAVFVAAFPWGVEAWEKNRGILRKITKKSALLLY